MKTFLLSILLLLPLAAQDVIFRKIHDNRTDTHVEVLSLYSGTAQSGYHPVRVVIANNQNRPHTIHLDFISSTSYRNEITGNSNFSFVAPPNKTITSDILVPLAPNNGSIRMGFNTGLKTNLRGTMGSSEGNIPLAFADTSQPAVLLSNTLHTANGSSLDTESNSRYSSRGSSWGSSHNFAATFDPKQLSDDWRAFSGMDSILLTDTDWSSIPPGPRNALTSWLRLGGQLIIFSSTQTTQRELGIPADPGFGTVIIENIPADLSLKSGPTVNLVTNQRHAKPVADSIANDYDSAWPLQDKFGEKPFNYFLFVAILIVFGIVVGPVNLFVFAKSGQRHRLFLTTPLISLVTSLILIVLIILQDGFGGNGFRLAIMEVRPDFGENAAYIHQEQFARTGVLTFAKFALDHPATFSPVVISSSRWARFTDDHNARGTFDLHPTTAKTHASGDWFQSRSEHGHILSAVIPTRGRIEATPDPATLLSTFDFPIKTILHLDTDGQWHHAENISKGRPIKLTPVEADLALKTINEYRSLFAALQRTRLENLRKRPDTFIAISNQAPAIQTHRGIRWQDTTIITGPIAR